METKRSQWSPTSQTQDTFDRDTGSFDRQIQLAFFIAHHGALTAALPHRRPRPPRPRSDAAPGGADVGSLCDAPAGHAVCCTAELAARGSRTSPRCSPSCPRRPAEAPYHAGCRKPPCKRIWPRKRTRRRARPATSSTFSNGEARGRPVGVRAPKAALPHRRAYEWHGDCGANPSCRAQPRVQGAVVEQHRRPMHRAARRCAAARREGERPRCYRMA